MYNQTKGFTGAGNSVKPIALDKLNTIENVYLERCKILETTSRGPFFTAGLFIDQKGLVLLVQDYQDKLEARTNAAARPKVWNKIPGGVAERDAMFSQQMFLSMLEDQLMKMKYSTSLINQIMDVEEELTRNAAERGMILELIEETGFYPKKFSFGCDGYRYNRETTKNDLWQVYFIVDEVLSPNSKFESPIKEIRNAPKLVSLDADIMQMRLVVSYNNLIQNLGSWPHKVAAQKLLFKKSELFKAEGDNFLYGKYQLAAAVNIAAAVNVF